MSLFETLKPQVLTDILGGSYPKDKFGEAKIYYLRFNQYASQAKDLVPLEDDPSKCTDYSIIQGFTKSDLLSMDSPNLLMISLLEVGNTIDGVTIASQILNAYAKDKNMVAANLPANFARFLNWKKRKCHCCLEYIIDAGKALTCFNLIRKTNPCLKVYC